MVLQEGVREHRSEGSDGLYEWYCRRGLESIDRRDTLGTMNGTTDRYKKTADDGIVQAALSVFPSAIQEEL